MLDRFISFFEDVLDARRRNSKKVFGWYHNQAWNASDTHTSFDVLSQSNEGIFFDLVAFLKRQMEPFGI